MNAFTAHSTLHRDILVVNCPDCEDGTRWRNQWGGNDPDVRPIVCEYCEGTGETTLGCEACPADAVEWFGGYTWCSTCLAEQKRDAFWVGE